MSQALSSYEVGALWGRVNLERAEALQSFQFYTGTTDYLEQSIERYRVITADKVQQVVAQYLQGARSTLTVLPKEQAPDYGQ